MYRLLCAVATGVLVAPVPVVAADALWQRAVDSFEESVAWTPTRFVVETDEYDGRGNLRSRSRVVSRRYIDGNGEIQSEIVEAEQLVGRGDPTNPFGGFGGGGDEGEDESEDDGESRFAAVSASVFDPDQQANLTVTRLGPQAVEGFGTAIAYRFELRPNDRARTTGTAWLDPTSGQPVRVLREVDPPIRIINQFVLDERYRTNGNVWLPDELNIDVVGRIIMVERRFVMQMTFPEYTDDPAWQDARESDGGEG